MHATDIPGHENFYLERSIRIKFDFLSLAVCQMEWSYLVEWTICLCTDKFLHAASCDYWNDLGHFFLQSFKILSCTIVVGTNLSQFICIGRFTPVSFQVLGHHCFFSSWNYLIVNTFDVFYSFVCYVLEYTCISNSSKAHGAKLFCWKYMFSIQGNSDLTNDKHMH